MGHSELPVEDVVISTYTIPTDLPEADGTYAWDSTTLILAEILAGGDTGIGYTYGNKAVAIVAKQLAEKCVIGQSVFDIPRLHALMTAQVRNDGSRGIAAMSISAIDIALWDLKAKLLNCSLADLLGSSQASVAVYGSGGFTSYSKKQLTEQLSSWAQSGMRSVKIKIGSDPNRDPERVCTARSAIGTDVALFVDANGAFTATQAMALSEQFAEAGVTWFEEPVSSDNLRDLRRVRDALPKGMDVAAGEYGYDSLYFHRMLESEAVDVLQLDATRCKGFTGFLGGAAIAQSFGYPISAHCAPTLHMHVGCAVPNLRHVEYFHDHARIEQMLFDGFIAPESGQLKPDRTRPGIGLEFKRKDAARFAA